MCYVPIFSARLGAMEDNEELMRDMLRKKKKQLLKNRA